MKLDSIIVVYVLLVMIKFVSSSNRNNHIFKSLMHLCISSYNTTSTQDFHPIDNDFNLFSKVKDDVVFQGWRKIIRRRLKLPNNKIKDFDILSTAKSIVVFTWNSDTKTTTLIQEYHPGIEKGIILYNYNYN